MKDEKRYCPHCSHCMKLLADKKFRVFNKKYKPFASIDLYHQLLYIEGEVQDLGLAQFDDIDNFIGVCEKEVKLIKSEEQK